MSEKNLELFFSKIVGLIKKDNDGNQYVDEDKFNYVFVSQKERNLGKQILEQYGISVKRDVTTQIDRSPLVKDMNYGEYESNNIENHDIPVMATIEWDVQGNIIYENYDKLVEFLEKEFLPNNVVLKKKRRSEDADGKLYPFVQLNKITKLKLSDIEVKYIMKYLEKEGIIVRGIDSTIDQDFVNYDYYRTYQNQVLPDTIDKQEIIRLFKVYSTTKDPVIRQQIINANLRLVPWVAYKYGMIYDVDSKLLESYGYEGLIYSFENFDYTRGNAFATYAIACITGYIKRGIQEIVTDYGRKGKWAADFVRDKKIVEETKGQTLRQNPDLAYDITELMIRDGSIPSKAHDDNITRINLMITESLDELLNNDNDYNELEDKEEKNSLLVPQSMIDNSLETVVDNSFINEAVKEILSTLTPRESKVIRLRFGLEDGTCRSLDEVAATLMVSPERIRQIEAKALRKLRHPGRSKQLREYLNELNGSELSDSVGPSNITESIDLSNKIR